MVIMQAKEAAPTCPPQYSEQWHIFLGFHQSQFLRAIGILHTPTFFFLKKAQTFSLVMLTFLLHKNIHILN